MGKVRRQFSDELKRLAVDDYVSGRKTAAEVAAEHQINANLIYRWRVELEAESRNGKIQEFESQGLDPKTAKRILQLEEQLELYQKKVAQQALELDLLKKITGLGLSQQERELTGLIDTLKLSARKNGRAK